MTPAEEYRHRLRDREAVAAQHEKTSGRIGLLRLTTFAVGIAAAWWSLQAGAFSPWWLLAPLGLFIALVVYHARAQLRWSRARRAVAFYRAGLARIEDRWSGAGQRGDQFADPHHVYAADLDLFGKGSLFELLCAARTAMGETALAERLLAPADAAEILDRQAAASELRDRLDLRETWAVIGEDNRGEDDRNGEELDALREWAEAPNALTRRWIPWAAWSIPVFATAAAAIWIVAGIASPFVLALLVALGFMRALRKQMDETLRGTENGSGDLKLLTALTSRIEAESFETRELRERMGVLSRGLPASQAFTRLATIVNLSESRENPILRLLNIPSAYTVHVALAAERWRSTHGRHLRAWLEAIGEFEALLSVAAYSYEHPDDPYPELTDGPASFVGTALAHPLLPQARCVPNDVSIEGDIGVLLVSGSNMSGKSTLLRTVGINTVLAMAGAPVRAGHLRMTPLQVGASIRINDSLHEGSSRFYAEITRLRQLHELSGRNPPLLFLLDELLQGTNSKDRRIGAEGIVRSFVDRGAIGLVTTHDLTLTEMAAEQGRRLRNLHFQEELEHGRMQFDFKLREGVVTKSNGLELMRAVGLDV